MEKQISDKEMELVAKQHELMDANPGTYIAKFLGWKNPKYPNSQGNFFDDIDPMDNSLIRSMAISDRIRDSWWRTARATTGLACIDMVKAHFESNPPLKSALYSMLEGFYNTGKEHICQYILDNYIYDEDCGADLSDVIRQRAQGIINLQLEGVANHHEQMGRWIAQLDGNGEGQQVHVGHVLGVVVPQVRARNPRADSGVRQYQNRGFEAIGVSLDQARSTWVGVIEQRGMQYPNVSQLQGWDSPIVKDYKITPHPPTSCWTAKARLS